VITKFDSLSSVMQKWLIQMDDQKSSGFFEFLQSRLNLKRILDTFTRFRTRFEVRNPETARCFSSVFARDLPITQVTLITNQEDCVSVRPSPSRSQRQMTFAA
jgi:hypothetical protein